MIVELPNGQELEFDEGTSPEVMKAAIAKNFPEYNRADNQAKNDSGLIDRLANSFLRYNVQDPLIGKANLIQNTLNSPHNLASLISSKLGEKIPSKFNIDFKKAFGMNPENETDLDRFIQFTPELLTAVMAPEANFGKVGTLIEKIPRAGKYLKTALGNATTQGLLAASQSPENQQEAALTAGGTVAPLAVFAKAASEGNPLLRTAGRLGIGGAAGLLGYGASKASGIPELGADAAAIMSALIGYKGIRPSSAAKNKLLKGVEGTDYQEVLDAAERLGLPYVTPAEASGNPFAGASQGNLGRTEKGARLLFDKGEQRAIAEKESIENMLNNLFNKERGNELSDLYKQARDIRLTQNDLNEFSNSDIFQAAVKDVESSPAYRQEMKDVRLDTVGYLDLVKRAMDDAIEKAGSNEARIIGKEKNKLLDIMDTASPSYKEARTLSNREILRKELEEAFNKQPVNATVFGKFLNDKQWYKKLLKDLGRIEKNTSNVEDKARMNKVVSDIKDMKKVFSLESGKPRLIDIPTAKNAEALARTSMSKQRSSYQLAIDTLKDLVSNGRYDVAGVELITNPKWANELSKMKNASDFEKFLSVNANLFGKANAQALGQQRK